MKNLNRLVFINIILLGIAVVILILKPDLSEPPSIPQETSTEFPSFLATSTTTATPTPIPPIYKTTVKQPSFCHNGPNENYLGAIPLPAGIEVDVLAMNSDGGDWFMIQGELIDPCWVQVGNLNLSPSFDPQKILVFNTIFTTQNSPCYASFHSMKSVQTIIPKGWRIVLYGKSSPNAEWILVIPHDSTSPCWVDRSILQAVNVADLPIESAEIPATVTVNP